MTFYEYMMRFEKSDSSNGDLARDMQRDKDKFPPTNDGKAILDYLSSKWACSECIETFIKCYGRYVKQELKRYWEGEDE